MKDMKMKTKTILGFATPVVLNIFNVILGNMAARGAMRADNIERYLRNSNIFTAVVAFISCVITVLLEIGRAHV